MTDENNNDSNEENGELISMAEARKRQETLKKEKAKREKEKKDRAGASAQGGIPGESKWAGYFKFALCMFIFFLIMKSCRG